MSKQTETTLLPPKYMNSVRDRMVSDFGETKQYEIGKALLSYISKTDPSEYSDMSFGNIKSIIKNRLSYELSDDEVVIVVSTMTSGRYRLLDMKFTFFDQDSHTPYLLSKDEVLNLLKTGDYYHPIVTDEKIENAKDHIVISYKASKLGAKIYQQGLLNASE